MTDPEHANALDESAALWAVRVDAGTLTPEQESELDAWTQADPRHAGAFARAMAANAYFDRAAALGLERAPPEDATSAPDEPGRSSLVNRRVLLGGTASALVASLLVAVGLRRARSGGDLIETPMGTIRRASLQDGSAVTLNSRASIEVAMEKQLRSVRLLAGEANFDVARDAGRPFVVDAGAVRIRVVGTSFQVRLLPQEAVAVTVREGIVDVSREGEPAMRLTAGDRTLLHPGEAAEKQHLSDAEIDRIGLWQSGQIDLTGMTLGDAAAEFARYSDRHIEIDDPAVAHLKVAGVYSLSDPIGFAHAAADSMSLSVSPSSGGVRLSATR